MALGQVPNSMLRNLELASSEFPTTAPVTETTLSPHHEGRIVRVNQQGSWPADEAVPDQRRPNKPQTQGNESFSAARFLQNVGSSVSVGENTAATAIITLLLALVRRRLAALEYKIQPHPAIAKLWNDLTTRLHIDPHALQLAAGTAGGGYLGTSADENFKQWFWATLRGEFDNAKALCDTLVAKLIALGAVATNLGPRWRAGRTPSDDPSIVEAKGGVVPEGPAKMVPKSDPTAEPILPARAGTNLPAMGEDLVRAAGPWMQALIPLPEVIRKLIPDQFGAVPASALPDLGRSISLPIDNADPKSLFGLMTSELTNLERQWVTAFPERRSMLFFDAVNRLLKNEGLPSIALEASYFDAKSYSFSATTWTGRVSQSLFDDAIPDNKPPMAFLCGTAGYLLQRVGDSVRVIRYMHEGLHLPTKDIEKLFDPQVVNAVLTNKRLMASDQLSLNELAWGSKNDAVGRTPEQVLHDERIALAKRDEYLYASMTSSRTAKALGQVQKANEFRQQTFSRHREEEERLYGLLKNNPVTDAERTELFDEISALRSNFEKAVLAQRRAFAEQWKGSEFQKRLQTIKQKLEQHYGGSSEPFSATSMDQPQKIHAIYKLYERFAAEWPDQLSPQGWRADYFVWQLAKTVRRFPDLADVIIAYGNVPSGKLTLDEVRLGNAAYRAVSAEWKKALTKLRIEVLTKELDLAIHVGSPKITLSELFGGTVDERSGVDPQALASAAERFVSVYAQKGVDQVPKYIGDVLAGLDENLRVVSMLDEAVALELETNSQRHHIELSNAAKSYEPTYLDAHFAAQRASERLERVAPHEWRAEGQAQMFQKFYADQRAQRMKTFWGKFRSYFGYGHD